MSYKTQRRYRGCGTASLVCGILNIVFGLVIGILMITAGGKLINMKDV